jgi:hypothetical protein
MRSFWPLILSLSALTLWAEEKMAFRPGAKPMRNEIRRFVKVGMQISAAYDVMVANGFTCSHKKNEDFLATDHGSTDSRFVRRQNYVYCDHTEPGFYALSPARRWQVAILNEEDKVSDILVSYGLIGL